MTSLSWIRSGGKKELPIEEDESEKFKGLQSRWRVTRCHLSNNQHQMSFQGIRIWFKYKPPNQTSQSKSRKKEKERRYWNDFSKIDLEFKTSFYIKRVSFDIARFESINREHTCSTQDEVKNKCIEIVFNFITQL